MKNRIILSVSLALATLASCSDFLDVKPTGKLIPTEANQLNNLLNNSLTYQLFFQDNNRGSLYGFLGDNIEITENEAIHSYGKTSVLADRFAAYTFYTPYYDPKIYVHYFWQYGIYLPVEYFNQVIDGIASLDNSQKETDYARSVVAQAKAARAFTYMTGTVIWGPMWDPSGDNNARVLPYRTSASPVDPNPDLSTTEEMFAQAWKDMEEALQDIPDHVPTPIRPNKAALHAMRAQYYMYKRDWANMLVEANNAWVAAGNNPDKLIYDLNDFAYKYIGTDPQDGTDYEATLVLEYKPNIAEPFSDPKSKENLYYKECPQTGGAYPSEDWLSLFDKNNDLRYKLFVLKYNSSVTQDGIRLYNFRGSKMQMNGGITYPELLLMRAEAYARTGLFKEALDDLNTLRRYRYAKAEDAPANSTDHPDGTALVANKDQLLKEIFDERRREQPSISYKRAVDLKRFVYDTGKEWCKTQLTNKIGAKEYTKDLSDKFAFTLPIANLTISYNPHWGLTKFEGDWEPVNFK